MQATGPESLVYLPYKKLLLKAIGELLRTRAIQVMDESVVVHDPQLVGREKRRQEVTGSGRSTGSQSLPHLGRRRGPMVTVGDIRIWNLRAEQAGDSSDRTLVIHDPDRVADAIIRRKIIYGIMISLPGFDKIIDGIDTLIG